MATTANFPPQVTTFGAIFAVFDLGGPVDVSALVQVMWNAELQRSASFQPTALELKIPPRAVGRTTAGNDLAAAVTDQGIHPGGVCTVMPSGKALLVTSHNPTVAQSLALSVAQSLRLAGKLSHAAPPLPDLPLLPAFAITRVAAYVRPLGPRAINLNLQKAHADLTAAAAIQGAGLGITVTVASLATDTRLKADVAVGVDGAARHFDITVSHRGVVSARNLQNVSDMEFVCSELLRPVLTLCVRP